MLRRAPSGSYAPWSMAATLALALTTPARSAHAFCRTTTQFDQSNPAVCPDPMGAPLAWSGRCASSSINATLLPDDLTRDEFRAQVDAAGARWTDALCDGGGSPTFHFVAFADVTHASEWNPRGANSNSVSFVDVWSDDAYHPAEAIAVTITTYDLMTGEIRDADTDLNLRNAANPHGFDFTTGAPDARSADLPTILTHELGHAQGLAHASSRSSVMWYLAGLGEQRRNLTDDDIAGICTIYPPTRSAACAPDPPGGFEGNHCGCRAAGAGRHGLWTALFAALAVMASRRRR